MASIAAPPRPARQSLAPDRFEQALAVGAVVLLASALTAIARGHAQWGQVPAIIWAHLATILVALALTPVMMIRPRGDQRHRVLGRIWATAMISTALISFFVHTSGPGRFSPIHIISFFTLTGVPRLWWTARHHDVAGHRRIVRGMVLGALLIAGFFTFPFHRLLGQWLFA